MDDAFQREYEALTAGAGIIRLEGWSTVRVTGKDRQSFLNNFSTNEVKSLTSGAGCEAFLCDAKGKIVAHAFSLVREEDVMLVGVPAMAAKLMPHLDRYIIREDVQLFDESGTRSWVLVAGPTASNLLPATDRDPWRHAALTIRGRSLHAARCPLPWPGGILIDIAAHEMGPALETLEGAGAVSCGAASFDVLRVESAWPLWGVDFDDTNLPQEVGRDAAAISFRKGCYLGQETVARIDALGHVNKRLSLVKFAEAPPAAVGGSLASNIRVTDREGQVVGTLTSVCYSPYHLAPLALAMLRRGHNEVGARVACIGIGGEVVAPLDAALG